jgi:hypothetical protein
MALMNNFPNPQAHGEAGRTVQTVEDVLTQAKKERKDPYLSLLDYQNTPIDNVRGPMKLLAKRQLQ